MLKTLKGIFYYILLSSSNKGQKIRRYFLAFCWQVYKKLVGLPLITKLDNGRFFILYPNSTNATANIYVKTYEAEYIYFLRNNLAKGGISLDIGAHMGIYTLLLVDHFDGGYCFEPAKDNFTALENNFFLNRMVNFKAVNLAVSDMSKSVSFLNDGPFSGTNRIEINSSTNDIPAVSIDDYITSNSLNTEKIAFVKIDTEGHEFSVLKGMKNLLASNKSMLILMEGYDYYDVAKYFSSLEYFIFSIDREGKTYIDEETILEKGNYFVVGISHPLYKRVFKNS